MDPRIRIRTKISWIRNTGIKISFFCTHLGRISRYFLTCLGMAFVTFESINHARHVLRDHKYSILHFRHSPPVSSVDMKPNVSRGLRIRIQQVPWIRFCIRIRILYFITCYFFEDQNRNGFSTLFVGTAVRISFPN
jgi:hypothetical protein